MCCGKKLLVDYQATLSYLYGILLLLLLCCESLVGQVAHSIWVASLVIGFYMLVFVCFIYLFCLLYGLIVLLPILDLRCRFPLSYCSLCVLLNDSHTNVPDCPGPSRTEFLPIRGQILVGSVVIRDSPGWSVMVRHGPAWSGTPPRRF